MVLVRTDGSRLRGSRLTVSTDLNEPRCIAFREQCHGKTAPPTVIDR